VHEGGETLFNEIEIVDSGANPASSIVLMDVIPLNTTYNNDALASVSPPPTFANGTLSWMGNVGFDSAVTGKSLHTGRDFPV
jgi:uncharacterized repeat protein (TIGR01451 family)